MVPNFGLMGATRSAAFHILQGRSDDLHRALAQDALLILVQTEDIRAGDRDKAFRLNLFRLTLSALGPPQSLILVKSMGRLTFLATNTRSSFRLKANILMK